MAASSSSSSGLTFKLHPLVIMNISDHFTRLNSQMNLTATNGVSTVVSSSPIIQARVYGCIIGIQNGRTVEIFNSFELLYFYGPPFDSLDRFFLLKQQELYKKVFPDFHILGWYSTGSDVEEPDMLLHRSLMDINENPVYLLLNPAINHAQRDLPITIYESEMRIIDGSPQFSFVRSSYTIETVEAERISVNSVAAPGLSDGNSAETQLASQLRNMHSSIKMLNSRLRLLHHYLLEKRKDVGKFHGEHSLLRQLSSLLRRLPATDFGKFKDDIVKEYNNTLLIAYLAICTNCSSTMDEIVDKFNCTYPHTDRTINPWKGLPDLFDYSASSMP